RYKMIKTFNYKFYILLLIACVFAGACQNKAGEKFNEWKIAGGNTTGNNYSSLTQIDTDNVQQLQVAWEFHTVDADTAAHSQIQCNRVIVNDVIYFTSPMLKVFAVDAATGKEKWMFSPYDTIAEERNGHFNLNNNRGVTYWTDGKNDERIFYTAGPYLHSID